MHRIEQIEAQDGRKRERRFDRYFLVRNSLARNSLGRELGRELSHELLPCNDNDGEELNGVFTPPSISLYTVGATHGMRRP
jgi:hypothetical protein